MPPPYPRAPSSGSAMAGCGRPGSGLRSCRSLGCDSGVLACPLPTGGVLACPLPTGEATAAATALPHFFDAEPGEELSLSFGRNLYT